jgi:hypothetical protein
MKFAVIIALIFWLVCGMAGAWMLGDLDRQDWKKIARGPYGTCVKRPAPARNTPRTQLTGTEARPID